MGKHSDMGENPIQSKIREDIAAQGWSWIWVFDPDGGSPPFAYTIGFKATFGHPETVVTGLPEGTSEGVLGSVHAELESGATFSDGDVSDDVLEAFAVRFMAVSVDSLSDILTQAVEFYGGRNFEALQLCWPDKDGNFPGDEDAPAWLNDRQRLRP
ncbi:hypothetical protein GCM10023084_20690 [Streptomyces lacrimifluminis]|uniref:DUF4262 domain-containing protein n=1 Tax=Streptomyces lacrimifluminis TaxID=1500077 RepID=A0A917L059_9ACTN|nr:DUF4262 domain-containing protein [Streptomyces lacrimifluminis]GGJ35191.1 hypothetical protein GCM10012282_34900 [Streptomyces lacrimifluminis]